ncbi:Transcriptional regulator, HxlR family [[Actinomadura] parvosata subsp. kistnae]|uniref:Transcriptional regulator n=2 Tax=Nonomuraea TaxID=83681 RepID=A0A1V0ABF2_9ACTN|nr:MULTISPECIES: helix-turn-helix domain-containing protein [unclassified Nonomuraea]AQZ67548.1 transcriptional regulator [Nonomuraea sp. ATCC 55076]NJP91162.1 helix-turn-helix transcriptional regulator [Nonomuraea sp. FMUSA5-5]SPL94179.1 Transcriptional regulator, HxlR family [Actinomadura parvosata subsp. kistnae]
MSLDQVCARFHIALELIGARWTGAVIHMIFKGAHRYADIKAAIPGINDTMLARRLRELESAGLVERRVLATSPVRVEYHLTAMGQELRPTLDELVKWSHKWIPLPDEEPDSTVTLVS